MQMHHMRQDSVCGTWGFHRKKSLPDGYVRVSLSLTFHHEFPSIMFPLSAIGMSSGKYLNVWNKCHCFSFAAVDGLHSTQS